MPPRGHGHGGGGGRPGGGGGRHHGHGHGYGAGGGPFFWGGSPGWWDYPRSELVVVEQTDKSRDKILAYIASLPEKERAKAFTKFFGSATATSGLLADLIVPEKIIGFTLLGAGALVLYLALRRKKHNPSRRRRRR